MTRNDTSYRQQGRAIVLAALMVLSVFGASVAFTGAATADDPATDSVVRDDSELSGIIYAGEDFDVNLDTGGDANLNATFGRYGHPVPQPGGQYSNESYLVRIESQSNDGTITSVTAVGGPYQNVSDAVSGVSARGTAYFEGIDTQGLETGTYTIANNSNTAGDFGTAGTFSINQQSLDAEFGSDSANTLDTVNVTLDSSRDAINSDNSAAYNVTVSADGLSDAQLIALFAGPNGDNNMTVNNAQHIPFDALGYSRGDDTRADIQDDGYVTLNLSELHLNGAYDINGDEELVANFSNLDAQESFPDQGSYEFDFRVTDADQVTASDSIEIGESDVGADFENGVSREEAGDIATFNLSFTDTDSAYVQIGSESAGFTDVLYVEQDEESPVEVEMNTRLMGTNATAGAVYDTDNTANFVSETHTKGENISDNHAPANGVSLYGDDGSDLTNQFDDSQAAPSPRAASSGGYLQDLHGDSIGAHNQTVRPLQPTDYQIIAADDAGLDPADEAVFDADPGGVANNQLDSKTLTLTQPSIEDITIHRATEDDADGTTDVDDLVEEASLASNIGDEVSLSDRLIIQVEASGIYGAMVANMTNNASKSENADWSVYNDEVADSDVLANVIDSVNEEGIDFSVESTVSTGNQGTNTVFLDSGTGSTYLVVDEESNQFFLIVDTSDDSAFTQDAPEETTEFTAELTYDGDVSENRYEFDESLGIRADNINNHPFEPLDDSHAYPYIMHGDDNTLSTSASFDLAPRSASFDNLNDDGVVQVPAEDNASITGTTNVAPGTDAEIRLVSSSGNNTFQLGDDVEISDDGSISGEFDLGEYPVGTEFDVNYRVAGGQISSVSGELVESVGEDTTDETDEQTNETDTGDDEQTDEEMDDEEQTDEEQTDEEQTDDGTPGFGAVVALVALVGAALLAVRRQN